MTETSPPPFLNAMLQRLSRLPLGWWRRLGWCAGTALYLLAWPRRRVVSRNLAYCFPEQTVGWRRQITHRVFVRFAQSWLDRVWLWHGDEALLRARLQCRVSAEPWDTAQVLFAPHFMGLDAGWTALTLLQDQPLVTLFAKSSSARQDAWIAQGRSRFAPNSLLPRVGSAKAVVRSLRDGASLYLLPDMDLGAKDAVFVPFMGRLAATVTALPRFAHLGHAAVRPVLTHMTATGYLTEVGDPWWDYPSGDDAKDAAHMNVHLEGWVRAYPDQYYWVHRRFKTRTGEMPDVYA